MRKLLIFISSLILSLEMSAQVVATISPVYALYDLTNPADVTTTITWNNAIEIISIVDNHAFPLVENLHYTVAGNTLTILNAYLSTVLPAIGVYVVLLIQFDQGVSNFTITAYAPVGVKEVIITDVQVHPNPSNGQFVIESVDNWTMMVYDITGRMVASEQISVGTNEIHLLNQPSGIYSIRLLNEEKSHTIRILIE